MVEPLLQISGLAKRFGGVIAADAITLDIPRGEFHAVIGPNGAGKTTLIGLLAGEISPLSGTIRFDGDDITALPVDRRSKLGMARSFQITSLFPEFTALDNVALAVQAHAGHSFRFWKDARSDEPACASRHARRWPASGCLAEPRRVSTGSAMANSANSKSRRRLPLKPRMLLLDEPMAGMGLDESTRMVEMLRTLKGSVTILLIEHDMETVFALADRITVLVYGRVIASGDPAAIRADPTVREAYLGEQEVRAHD